MVTTMISVSGKQFKVKAALPAIEVIDGRAASPVTIPAGAVIRMISEIDVNNRLVEAVWRGHRCILIADDLIHCAVDVESGEDLGTLNHS